MRSNVNNAYWCNKRCIDVRVKRNLKSVVDEFKQVRIRPVRVDASNIGNLLVFSHYSNLISFGSELRLNRITLFEVEAPWGDAFGSARHRKR